MINRLTYTVMWLVVASFIVPYMKLGVFPINASSVAMTFALGLPGAISFFIILKII